MAWGSDKFLGTSLNPHIWGCTPHAHSAQDFPAQRHADQHHAATHGVRCHSSLGATLVGSLVSTFKVDAERFMLSGVPPAAAQIAVAIVEL
eukprot:27708-Chlamydomonas_euryale.AAC.8